MRLCVIEAERRVTSNDAEAPYEVLRRQRTNTAAYSDSSWPLQGRVLHHRTVPFFEREKNKNLCCFRVPNATKVRLQNRIHLLAS